MCLFSRGTIPDEDVQYARERLPQALPTSNTAGLARACTRLSTGLHNVYIGHCSVLRVFAMDNISTLCNTRLNRVLARARPLYMPRCSKGHSVLMTHLHVRKMVPLQIVGSKKILDAFYEFR